MEDLAADLTPLLESLWAWERRWSSSRSVRTTPLRRAEKKWRPRALRSPFGPVSPRLLFSAAERSQCVAMCLRASNASCLALSPSGVGPKSLLWNSSQYAANPSFLLAKIRPRMRRSAVEGCPVMDMECLQWSLAVWGLGWPGYTS